jgi:phosphoglucomutase
MIRAVMSEIGEQLRAAVAAGKLLPEAGDNAAALLAGAVGEVAAAAVGELVAAGEWQELNDRFFKTLEFGTGGLRGRTIGRVVTPAEQGTGGPNGRPQHPCIGTATMNFYNLSRAVRGLIAHVRRHLEARGDGRRPRLVFAHDPRHFSHDFAAFCARVAVEHGCDAFVYDGARSTPQLSFTVRELHADAGAVITASHNPPHDNGFKVYFDDGAQIIEPHASAIIAAVNAITSERYEPLPAAEQGQLTVLGGEMDRRYMARLKSLLLRPELLAAGSTKVVFTNLHGTGGHIIVPLLRELGLAVDPVAAQDVQDGRFPTVDSPNPENAPALALAIQQAEQSGAAIVIGTDPDSDRMGVAVRDAHGRMTLLTGNQIGSLLAWYRLKTFFDLGLLNETTRARAVLVKTFVTTGLQSRIAGKFGVGVVDTLTGFKYIAAKLRKYEEAIPAAKRGDYRALDEAATRALRLDHSRFFVFGGEESYGYLGADFVRDKDANGAAVMFAEMAAYAATLGKTVVDVLADVHAEFGYHLERGQALVMEGADGAARIRALADSFSDDPPATVDGAEVTRVRDFWRQTIHDQEGDELPKEKMLILDLADGRSFAVRPSGTEPKIKFYLFGAAQPGGELAAARQRVAAGLDALWTWIEADAARRMG